MGSNNKKALLIILDGVGVGALPDAHRFGDDDANTLKNISVKKPFDVPNLQAMGLGNVGEIGGVEKTPSPKAFFGKMNELSSGKDSVAGHWEITGIVTEKPFATFPEGFPPDLIERFKREVSVEEVLGNKPASGTKIIEELGDEHVRTTYPIVYTSADSVFQIAAHKGIIPLEKLYEMCETARKICNDYNIARVIARPFTGKNASDFKRTPERKDFSVKPPEPFLLTRLTKNNIPVYGVGKIDNLFADVGITEAIHTENNRDGLEKLIRLSKKVKHGLIFTNLIDFDMLYGHRRDVDGFHAAILEFDRHLPEIIETLERENLLIITADHGTDPTTLSTDHSREYVPLLAHTKFNERGTDLGIRESFADVGQTLAEFFGVKKLANGKSFYKVIRA